MLRCVIRSNDTVLAGTTGERSKRLFRVKFSTDVRWSERLPYSPEMEMRSEPISSGDGILHACDIGTRSGNGESASRRRACAKVTWVGAKRTDAAMPTIRHALRLLAAAVAGSLGPSLAQDLDPRALAAGCATCHQASVESPPPLGGQSRDALLAKLRGFREGTRSRDGHAAARARLHARGARRDRRVARRATASNSATASN